jgi:hypothetical protein
MKILIPSIPFILEKRPDPNPELNVNDEATKLRYKLVFLVSVISCELVVPDTDG